MLKCTLNLFLLLLICFAAISAKGQVTAGFTLSDTAGCAPIIVHFTNTSTGATSYFWDLGNGTTTSATNASASYTSAGSYTVTLTAYNSPATSVYTKVIKGIAAPSISFSASSTAVCPAIPITFISTSIANYPGPMTYIWNFGDGSSSTANSPVYAYFSPGSYNTTLFARNNAGCISSLGKPGYVTIYAPATVGFNAAATSFCNAPGNVSFTNTTTGAGPLSYTWQFGDGSTSPGVSPAHTYGTHGTYDVKLVVTDGDGCKDSLLQAGYINVGGITAGFTSAANGCLSIPVGFSNTSSAHTSCTWYFGDGDTSTLDNPSHAYAALSTYNVKLVINNGTCADSVTHPVNITKPAATVGITQPCLPASTFDFTAVTVPGTSTVNWLFGDHTSGSGNTPTHAYSGYPLFADTTTTFVTDIYGCRDTVVTYDTIRNLRVSLGPTTPAYGCVPLKTHFGATAFSLMLILVKTGVPPIDTLYVSYPHAISSYSWNFGDGSPLDFTSTPSHTFLAVGVYTVSCHIVTTNGCLADTTMLVTVGTPQVPSFTRHPTHLCAGQPMTYTSTSTNTALIDRYEWHFADGKVSDGDSSFATHRPTRPYTFLHDSDALVVYNNGCASAPFYLRDTADSPNAVIAESYACIPDNEILFFDSSYGDNAPLWSFGDGTTSTKFNPVHDFPGLSSYSVTLTTYNNLTGCRDTTSIVMESGRLKNIFTPFHPSICRDVVDTITTVCLGTDSSWGYTATWYINGLLTDVHTPMASPPSGTNKLDTIYHPMRVRGKDSVTLIVTDNHGCLDTFGTNIIVAKPIDNFSFTPSSGCTPLHSAFTDLSTDVAGALITKFSWNFGDGTIDTAGRPGSISHTYTTSGTYTIQEVAIDSIGCADTLISPTHITLTKPTASFTASSTFICNGQTISFNNTSTPGTSSSWDFGDGITTTAPSPSHTYASAGNYTVKLAVKDLSGCVDTALKTGFIMVNPVPTASFSMSDSFSVCPPLFVSFTNTSTGAATYHWTFGDGTSSNSPSPSDIYITRSLFTIKLFAISNKGCTDSAVHHARIFGSSGGFTYTPEKTCSQSPVHFTAILTGVTNVVWDFDDGVVSGTSLKDTISHIYTTPGFYVPTLLLTDSTGCTGFSHGDDTIKVDTVIPHFVFSPNPVCQNSSVSFKDSSSSLYSLVSKWLWTFGPGATSTKATPAYTYTVSGAQPVTLVVTDSFGCTNTITQNVTVNPAPAAITGDMAVCNGLTTALSDGTGGGTWSSSNTAVATISPSGGVVSGLFPGTTTITYTAGAGCTAYETFTDNPLPNAITGVTTVCSGFITTLSDPGGGTWSSSNTIVATTALHAGTISGISAGTAVIAYTLATGCFSTIIVTVGASPGSISGPSVLCTGIPADLSDAVSGGVWSSSNTAVAKIDAGTGIVTGVATGSATISYNMGLGCATSKIVNVTATPSGITGTFEVCAGSKTGLTDVTGGGTWSSSNTTIATVAIVSGFVTGVSSGAVTISYTTGGSCSATKIVTVNPIPDAITGITHVCVGQTSMLIDFTTGGIWSSSNTTIAPVDPVSGLVTGISGGASNITYMLITGCKVATGVTVNLPPFGILGTPEVCTGSTTVLLDVGGGTWTSSNTASATIDGTGLVTGITTGTSTISYTISNGCTATLDVTAAPTPGPITGNTGLCIGLTTSLIDGSSGTWISSNTAIAKIDITTGIATGIAPDTATIVFTSAAGCSVTITVTVNPVPVPITGIANVCAGLATTLKDATIGGTWSSGNMPVATIDAGTGLVTGIKAGTAAISYSLATGCYAARTITVNPDPAMISGVPDICAGSATTLSDSTGGGKWSSSNTSIVTVIAGLGIVKGISGGTTTITYVLATGCKATIQVTILPLPAPISGNTNLCIGLATALSDPASGGIWSSSNTATANIDAGTGIISGIALGIVIITYQLPTGCLVTTTVTVNPLPDPITGTPHVCAGSTTLLADASGGAWSSSTTAIATVDGAGNVTGIAAGTATITFASGAACNALITVTVYPVIAAIAGTTNLCKGLSATLSDATAGGVWSSSNTTVATITTTGVVIGLSVGSSVISYSEDNSCDTAVSVLTINPQPDAGTISGNTVFCTGIATQLTETTTGGTWKSGNDNIATVTNTGLITGVAPGGVTISYAYTNSCGTAVALLGLTINLSPNIAHIVTHPDSVLCSNTLFQNFGADVPASTGVTYTWSADNADIYATSASRQYCLISFNTHGSSVVKLLTEGSSDCTLTDSLTFNIGVDESPNPVVVYYTPEFVCKDNTADQYQWGFDDVHTLDSSLFAGEVNENYYNPFPDFTNRNYWVMTYHHGCLQKSYYNQPTQTNVIVANSSPEILVFPNPADSKINIEVKGINAADAIGVKLYDMIGKEIEAGTLDGGKGSMNVALLPAGAYMIVCSKDGVKIGTKAFVKN